MAEGIGSSSSKGRILYQYIQRKLDELPDESEKCCIYRVPKLLRGVNPEAYTPTAVPIGPLHWKDNSLNSSSAGPDFFTNGLYKLKYLKSFLREAREPYELEHYLNIVEMRIAKIRACYADSNKIFNDDDGVLTELVFLDSVFIIQLFREYSNLRRPLITGEGSSTRNGARDSILMTPLKHKEIASDIMLAENQLPFFILKELYDEAFGSVPTFIEIACKFLKIDEYAYNVGIDLQELYDKAFGSAPPFINQLRSIDEPPCHLLDMVRISLRPRQDAIEKYAYNVGIDLQEITCPTVTKLFEAGIKFEVNHNSTSLLGIHFDMNQGILSIPKLRVGDETERLFRNLIAFEQSHIKDRTYITDYQFFLDCLINTATDVQLLTKAGIIENWLGSEKNLSDLINSMGKHAYNFTGDYFYLPIARKLNSYHKKKWNRYRAVLKQVYFCHPWAIVPMVYAILLLILTIIQAVGGILSVPGVSKNKNN